ncbi:MAG: MFS transporter [Bacteroidales bacterium]|nr:MFS transporter [Bacteroidales bacterium]MCF8406114.1 MFS transporter [Bacteroidales bacterium]
MRKINFPTLHEAVKLPIFYFLLTSAFASWQSFYNLHLDTIGFSSFQIGALNAIFISTSAIVVPFWGMIADKYGTNRILLLLTSVCAGMVFLIGETLVFHWMIVLVAVISVFHQPSGAVIDGMTMGFVRNNPKYTYGQFRLWGSAGYAICSLAVGYFAKENTNIIFKIAAGLFLLMSLINLFTLPTKPVTGRTLVNFKSFGIFFRNRNLLIFLIIIMLYGVSVSPLYQFINLYYSDIGADSSFIGWVFFAQAAFEVPAFLIAAKMVKKVKPKHIILFAMIVSALRMLLYGFIDRPELAISLSIFHCITIAFFIIGVVEYVQLRTPDHLRTTGQALIWAFHFGAGVTIGNLILGYLRDATGMMKAMHIHTVMAALVIIGAVVFFFFSNGKKELT